MKFTRRLLLEPESGCPWADKMVLNPAMIADPADPGRLYMLFRATGPWPEARQPGRPLPYPIFLGFGESRDGGAHWEFDFSRPALAPRLDFERDAFVAASFREERMFDYANGCIEDPRLFEFEKEIYLSAACRAFPPGPYWEHDDPLQCLPEWAADPAFGHAVNHNSTVSLLYRVDLAALARCDYPNAFRLVAPLHQPDVSDNRDVVLFSRRINGKIVCIHRPKWPWRYEFAREVKIPSIFIAAADSLSDFYDGKAEQRLFAVPEFSWEANRIGASWAPLELEPGLWLLPYHGKQDDQVGYTQSFMLLRETGGAFPEIIARPAERLLYATEPWELEGDFTIPCLFTCSGVVRRDGTLLMGYGAADAKVGMVEVKFDELTNYLKRSI